MDKTKMQKDLGMREASLGGHKFEIALLPALPAGEAFFQLLDIAGPSVGMAIDKINNSKYVLPEDDTAFVDLITIFTSRLYGADTQHLIAQLLEGCYMDGRLFNANQDLRGEFRVYTDLVIFALRENFSNFFISHLKDMGLEIPTWDQIMEIVKAQASRSEEEQEQL